MVCTPTDDHVTPDDISSPGLPELPAGYTYPAPTTTVQGGTKDKYTGIVHHLYGGEIELVFWPRLGRRTHVYQLNGIDVTGATTVLKIIDKPWMGGWATSQMEECALGELQPFVNSSAKLIDGVREVVSHLLAVEPIASADELTTVLNINGEALLALLTAHGPVLSQDKLGEALEHSKGAFRRTSKGAASIGSSAHGWIEDYITRRIDGLAPGEVRGFVMPNDPAVQNSIDAFLTWEAKNSVLWLSTERAVYSREEQYCGTMDFEALVNGKLVAGDLKTSKGIFDEYWLQVAAYLNARVEESGGQLNYDGGRLILRLDKETGEFEAEQRDDPEWQLRDYVGFCGALQLKSRLDALAAYSKG